MIFTDVLYADKMHVEVRCPILRSCRTRKRAGVVRRSDAAALHARPAAAAAALLAVAADSAAAATTTDAIRQFTD